MDILGDVCIRYVDDIMSGIHIRSSEDLNHLSRLIGDFFSYTRCSNFWSFGIDKNTDVGRYSTHIIDNLHHSFLSGMGGIHSDHIHSCEE